MIATELFDFSAGGGGALEFKRSRAAKKRLEAVAVPSDVESGKKQEPGGGGSSASSDTLNIASDEEALEDISGSESIFTWENLEYTVPYRGGSRKLLNKVDGIAKPGIMVRRTSPGYRISERYWILRANGSPRWVSGNPVPKIIYPFNPQTQSQVMYP
jgi:hypothetical protein